MAAVIPCLVVRFQNSSMTSDGRFADAATLNAQPTRNVTFSFLKANAQPHGQHADEDGTPSCPAVTFPWSVRSIFMKLVMQVMRDRAAGGHDQAADGAQHGRERDRRDDGEQQMAEALGQQRGGHVVVGRIQRAAGHRPQAQEKRQHVEEPDAGDADDGALRAAAWSFTV